MYNYFDIIDITTENKHDLQRLVREQGNVVCRNLVSESFIKNLAKRIEFGFYRASPQAQIGQSQRRGSSKDVLQSFAVCTYIPDIPETLQLDLICSRNQLRSEGSELLQIVENHARHLGCKYLELDALGEPKLLTWYESHGFKIRRQVYNEGGNCVKIYHMYKVL